MRLCVQIALVKYQKAQLTQTAVGVTPRYILDINKVRYFIQIFTNLLQIMQKRIVDVQTRFQYGGGQQMPPGAQGPGPGQDMMANGLAPAFQHQPPLSHLPPHQIPSQQQQPAPLPPLHSPAPP